MSDLPPPDLTPNARVVLEKRYLLRGPSRELIETPQGLFERVAGFIAEGDRVYGVSDTTVQQTQFDFYKAMAEGKFLPNSPTLMNAGKPQGQLSACFVLPVEDSLEGIFDTLKHAALIHQSGGGTGFAFSRLRPAGDVLKQTSGSTSGPLSFMDVYNSATEAIKQGGTRRGANMGILRIDHPDIEAFISAKNDLSRLTNFNISVAVTEKFMAAVNADEDFSLIHPVTKAAIKSVKARKLMDKIVSSAWQTGEPGLIFIDRINADNPTPGVGEMESTNPCGEVPLLPYEACNLGSINLARFVANHSIDWDSFQKTIETAVHFLDNVITQNTYPLEQITHMVEVNRKIGLGLMGWADTLIALNIPYDSDDALELAKQVSTFMNFHSKRASVKLSQSRGRFPFFDKSIYAVSNAMSERYGQVATPQVSATDWQALDAEIACSGIRNATTICYAPTGTISMIAGCSGGIEPLYALKFNRYVMDGTQLSEYHPAFARWVSTHGGLNVDTEQIIENTGSIQTLSSIEEPVRRRFVTAHDISPEWHIRMQASFQTQCDNAVSKTINFPESATRDDIAGAYQLAAKLGLKGITVYRNNSRQFQPMALSNVQSATDGQHCPECGKPLIRIEGCYQCPDCQYAYCG